MRKKEVIINYVSHIMAVSQILYSAAQSSSGGLSSKTLARLWLPAFSPQHYASFLSKERQVTWRYILFLETIFSDKLLCNSEAFPYSWPLDHTSIFPALWNWAGRILSSRSYWSKLRERKSWRGEEGKGEGWKWGEEGENHSPSSILNCIVPHKHVQWSLRIF